MFARFERLAHHQDDEIGFWRGMCQKGDAKILMFDSELVSEL